MLSRRVEMAARVKGFCEQYPQHLKVCWLVLGPPWRPACVDKEREDPPRQAFAKQGASTRRHVMMYDDVLRTHHHKS